jgi:hypothetical protein
VRRRSALVTVLVLLTTALAAAPAHAEDNGAIRGRVTNESGAPIAGVRAALWRFLPHLVGTGNDDDGADDGWVPVYTYALTATDGTYVMTGLARGLYTLHFYEVNDERTYADQWYGGAVEFSAAKSFYVVYDGTSIGKDAVLAKGAHVTGRVTADPDQSVAWLRVSLYRRSLDGSYERRSFTSVRADDPAGVDVAFALGPIPAGTYRLGVGEVAGWDEEQPPEREYWNDKPSFASADDFVVAAGTVHSGLDVHLTAAGPPPAIENTSLPRITGMPSVGRTLGITIGQWSTTPGPVSFQWFVAGTPVPGATASTFVPRASDIGKTVVATATATAPGLTPTTSASTATVPVGAGRIEWQDVAHLVGKARVGKRLAVRMRFLPSDAAASYQWSVDGERVRGWDGRSSIRLRPKHLGDWIAVRVAVSKAGYVTLTRRLGTISPVRPARVTTRPWSIPMAAEGGT